ncbi:MAG: DUF935 family protein [Nostoc sp. NMS7]|uniref:phage portal protein family protein n=1 Tax=Nostoc sp. NMS7 TaxID=2815391 RepID=UPI0025EAF1D8|nr:DUF935 family protein [Nostoc sp. NMS7]MBN3949390.1 DUF935 family protein [Nostoc sp. NMS7]
MPLSAILSQEIAAADTDPRHYLFDGFAQIPDDTLLYLLGGDTDFYDLVLKDAHAKAVLETRDRNVTCREWKVTPASDSKADKKAADVVKSILTDFDFDKTCSDMNRFSFLRGTSFLEFKWDLVGNLTKIKRATAKPTYRFRFKIPDGKEGEDIGYYEGYEIRLLSRSDYYEGMTVPPKRILCHSYDRINDNPWGIGLGRVLYWLAVVFKKELTKQRLIYLDKYAQPSIMGKAGKSNEEQREEFTKVLAQMFKKGYGTLPPGWDAVLMEAQRSSTSDVYQTAIDWCNAEMSKLVLGETLSLELPQGAGSRAATQTHQDGSTIFLAKFDSDRLSTGPLRELARWITELNVPDAQPPMIWRHFPELEESEDLNQRVNRDNTLNTIGYKISVDKVKEVYGDGYEDTAAVQAEQQKQQTQQQQDSGAFDVGFEEDNYEARKAIAFKKRLEKSGQNLWNSQYPQKLHKMNI